MQEISLRKSVMKSRVEEYINQAVVQWQLTVQHWDRSVYPMKPRKKGILVSPDGVQSIWLRHDMENLPETSEDIVRKRGTRGYNPRRKPGTALEKAKEEK